MKRIFLTLFGVVLVIGVLAGVGYAGYQVGIRQGARPVSNGDLPPFVGRPDPNSERPPFPLDRGFERGFDRDFPHGGFRMMQRGGFGFFSPFMVLGHLAFWVLLFLVVYLLFTRNGWRLTRTEQTIKPSAPSGETATKVQEEETKNE